MTKPKRKRPARGAIRRKGYSGQDRFLPTDPVYIYAFRCEMFIKIGIAVDWRQRLSSIQSHNPFAVEKLLARKVPNDLAAQIEHAAHIALRGAHHRGEWFLCTKADAQRTIMSAIKEAQRGWKPSEISPKLLNQANDAIAAHETLLANLRARPTGWDHGIDTEGVGLLENSLTDNEAL